MEKFDIESDIIEHGPQIESPVFDLLNFPDPGLILCLEAHRITTENQFKEFWKNLTGQDIIKFKSFTPPA